MTAFNRIPLEQRYPEGLVYSSQTARKMKFPPKCQLKPSRASAASISHRISIERSNFPAETPSSRPLMAGGGGGSIDAPPSPSSVSAPTDRACGRVGGARRCVRGRRGGRASSVLLFSAPIVILSPLSHEEGVKLGFCGA